MVITGWLPSGRIGLQLPLNAHATLRREPRERPSPQIGRFIGSPTRLRRSTATDRLHGATAGRSESQPWRRDRSSTHATADRPPRALSVRMLRVSLPGPWEAHARCVLPAGTARWPQYDSDHENDRIVESGCFIRYANASGCIRRVCPCSNCSSSPPALGDHPVAQRARVDPKIPGHTSTSLYQNMSLSRTFCRARVRVRAIACRSV